jgi:hypothetical protein
MTQTEGKHDPARDAEVARRHAAAQGGPCRHPNVTVLTMTDRRTTPPTVTHTITCDDCSNQL